jgi:hypothetical protein
MWSAASSIARMDGRRRAALHIDHFLRMGDPLRAPDDADGQLSALPAVA